MPFLSTLLRSQVTESLLKLILPRANPSSAFELLVRIGVLNRDSNPFLLRSRSFTVRTLHQGLVDRIDKEWKEKKGVALVLDRHESKRKEFGKVDLFFLFLF
jgi:hypothetical protein